MTINGDIYNKGIHGKLKYEEIESLPRDYEILKQFFHDANNLKIKKHNKTMEKTTNLLTYKLNDKETIVVNLVTTTEEEQITEETTTNENTSEENINTTEKETITTVKNLLDKFIQRKNDMLVKN